MDRRLSVPETLSAMFLYEGMPCCPIDRSGKAAVVVTLGNKDRQQLTLPTKTRIDTIDGQLKRGEGGQLARTVNRPKNAEREMRGLGAISTVSQGGNAALPEEGSDPSCHLSARGNYS